MGMYDGQGEGSDSLHWLVAMIQRRMGRWGERFADLLIFSIAAGLIAWALQQVWVVLKPVYDALTKPTVLPYIVALVLIALTVLIVLVPFVLFVDTLKRRVMLRAVERDYDRILQRQDLTDELRAEIEEAQRNVRTGQPVSYLRPYKQMWQRLRSKFRRKRGE